MCVTVTEELFLVILLNDGTMLPRGTPKDKDPIATVENFPTKIHTKSSKQGVLAHIPRDTDWRL